MIYSAKFIAVLDACVLYPAPLRDLLLSMATVNLYKPKWTKEIQGEWKRNLLLNRPDLLAGKLDKTILSMNNAFPDANISRYASLIPGLILPDPDDRHVLAAAIRGHADTIITFNSKDFPTSRIKKFDIGILHPDVFVSDLIDLSPHKTLEAVHLQVLRLRNPPLSMLDVINSIERCGLPNSAARLRKILQYLR